uniref:Beclin-1-like protein n=1 Tax=Angiostrongylus cantonensis TaxID=6313 RepID=A0A0K0DG95_ANGCA
MVLMSNDSFTPQYSEKSKIFYFNICPLHLTTSPPLLNSSILLISHQSSFKQLQLDDDGCPICPLCGEKLIESEWSHHIEHEKKKLLGVIQRLFNNSFSRRKRELELLRIRNNQQKRLACELFSNIELIADNILYRKR